jgi:hypothetical protein
MKSGAVPSPGFQQVRLLGNRRRIVNRRDREFLSELLFDLQQQAHRHQRIAAEIEEITVGQDGRCLQTTRPDVGEGFDDRLANGAAIAGGRCHFCVRRDVHARLRGHGPRRPA